VGDKKKHYYIIGSLRNPYVPELEKSIIKNCPTVKPFAEWHGAGSEADDAFKEYHNGLGRSFREALLSPAARHIFEFDKHHLDRCDGAILLMPSGKSCHLEAGYMVGKGKPVLALYPDGEPEGRYDIMMQFLTEIFYSESELIEYFNRKQSITAAVNTPSIDWDRVPSEWRPTQRRSLPGPDVV
jgi:hypothetical protein